jgi:hypothetical protein
LPQTRCLSTSHPRGQIAKAIQNPDFWTERNELAIATARNSRKIDGSYQDVLRWARHLGAAKTFFDRLNRSGTGNDDMRAFVATLRDHLRDAGAPHDDEMVWKVLARLQILIFDYTAVGSAAEELSRERAVRVLPPEDATNASFLWSALTDLSEEIAADGGDRDRTRIIADLVSKSIRIPEDRRLTDVIAAIAEASSQALADIDDRVGAVTLARTGRVEAVNEALGQGRYVEIRGDAGVGKSCALKHFAELFAAEGRIVVLSPGRTQPRGWTTMRNVLGFNGTARDLLGELASDGGAALFIDNLDSFSDEEQRTVNDLVRAAADVPGISVLATARRNFGVEEPSWLDSDAVKALGAASPVVIEELSEAEIVELSETEPRLADLLVDRHPARAVVRNLYRLSRLAVRPASGPMPTTELDMAEQWWISADGERDDSHRERARLLRALAEMALGGAFVLDVRSQAPAAIKALVKSETLRDLGNDRVTFGHDVLRQWAIGNLLAADETAFDRLYQGLFCVTHGDSRIAAMLIQGGVEDLRHAVSSQIARGLFGRGASGVGPALEDRQPEPAASVAGCGPGGNGSGRRGEDRGHGPPDLARLGPSFQRLGSGGPHRQLDRRPQAPSIGRASG